LDKNRFAFTLHSGPADAGPAEGTPAMTTKTSPLPLSESKFACRAVCNPERSNVNPLSVPVVCDMDKAANAGGGYPFGQAEWLGVVLSVYTSRPVSADWDLGCKCFYLSTANDHPIHLFYQASPDYLAAVMPKPPCTQHQVLAYVYDDQDIQDLDSSDLQVILAVWHGVSPYRYDGSTMQLALYVQDIRREHLGR
jgi:hypothetical protein